MNRNRLKATLERHEGKVPTPYVDSVGKVTIGVGRNLTDRGLSESEIQFLLDNDVENTIHEARSFYWFGALGNVRQEVVLNMIFNLGLDRFRKFRKTIDHIANGEYEEAADEMLDSRWAKQVGRRATELSDAMRSGRWS